MYTKKKNIFQFIAVYNNARFCYGYGSSAIGHFAGLNSWDMSQNQQGYIIILIIYDAEMNPIVESGSATNVDLFKTKAEGFLWSYQFSSSSSIVYFLRYYYYLDIICSCNQLVVIIIIITIIIIIIYHYHYYYRIYGSRKRTTSLSRTLLYRVSPDP